MSGVHLGGPENSLLRALWCHLTLLGGGPESSLLKDLCCHLRFLRKHDWTWLFMHHRNTIWGQRHTPHFHFSTLLRCDRYSFTANNGGIVC